MKNDRTVHEALYSSGHGLVVGHDGHCPSSTATTLSTPTPVARRNPATRIKNTCPAVAGNTILDRTPQKSSLHATAGRDVAVGDAAVSVVSKVVCGEHVSIVTVPVTGDTYRKNTSAPSSEHVVTPTNDVAHSVEKKVVPLKSANAPSGLSLTGGVHTVVVAAAVVTPAVVVDGVGKVNDTVEAAVVAGGNVATVVVGGGNVATVVVGGGNVKVTGAVDDKVVAAGVVTRVVDATVVGGGNVNVTGTVDVVVARTVVAVVVRTDVVVAGLVLVLAVVELGQALHTTVVLLGIPRVLTLGDVGQHVPLGAVATRPPRPRAKANSGELMQPEEQSADPAHRNGDTPFPPAAHSYSTAKLFAPASSTKQTPAGVTTPGLV